MRELLLILELKMKCYQVEGYTPYLTNTLCQFMMFLTIHQK